MKLVARPNWTRHLRRAMSGMLGEEGIELLANLAWLG